MPFRRGPGLPKASSVFPETDALRSLKLATNLQRHCTPVLAKLKAAASLFARVAKMSPNNHGRGPVMQRTIFARRVAREFHAARPAQCAGGGRPWLGRSPQGATFAARQHAVTGPAAIAPALGLKSGPPAQRRGLPRPLAQRPLPSKDRRSGFALVGAQGSAHWKRPGSDPGFPGQALRCRRP